MPWAVYGAHSIFHIYTNPAGRAIDPMRFDVATVLPDLLKTDKREDMLNKLRLAMLINGVDLLGWRGGVVSAAHTQVEVDQTIAAWRASLRMLKDEGELPTPTARAS